MLVLRWKSFSSVNKSCITSLHPSGRVRLKMSLMIARGFLSRYADTRWLDVFRLCLQGLPLSTVVFRDPWWRSLQCTSEASPPGVPKTLTRFSLDGREFITGFNKVYALHLRWSASKLDEKRSVQCLIVTSITGREGNPRASLSVLSLCPLSEDS